MASCSKFWLNLDYYDAKNNVHTSVNPALIFNRNLEYVSTWFISSSWSNLAVNYGLSQTSVDYLWSITGLISSENVFNQKAIKYFF